jgi:tellurite resistance protein TehA-like permease
MNSGGMVTDALPRAAGKGAGRSSHRPFWTLKDLERPGQVFRDLGPNWFAAIMGTGIVANAAALLPVQVLGLHTAGLAVWVFAAACLVALSGAWAVHWIRHTERAKAHATDPVMAQFWGAPPMALMTVGSGTLLLGKDLIGLRAAVDADWALWSAGTTLGLVTACWIPYLMMTRHSIASDGAFGGWLMPVVPPMVSVIIITLLWSRLVTSKTLPAVMVPTLWIVLGTLGQSVTAAGNLAAACRSH